MVSASIVLSKAEMGWILTMKTWMKMTLNLWVCGVIQIKRSGMLLITQ